MIGGLQRYFTQVRGAVVFFIGLGAIAAASGAPLQDPLFGVRTQGVLVEVEVTRDAVVVFGLKAADFEVRDDGVLQSVELLETQTARINTVLAIDTSLSTAGQRFADLTNASRELLDGLKPGDGAALITFDERVVPRVPLTTDLNSIRTAFNQIKPSAQTALFDGVYAALLTTHAAAGRSMVLVYTDSVDTASWLERDDVLNAAKRSDAVLYAVVLRDDHEPSSLKELVDATGGQVLVIDSTTGLANEFARILRAFRSRYVLTFVPRGVTLGGFHRLDVRVKRGGVTVNARRGYFNDFRNP